MSTGVTTKAIIKPTRQKPVETHVENYIGSQWDVEMVALG
jgi:hypothetical protein